MTTFFFALLLMCLRSQQSSSSEEITFLEEGSFFELDAFSAGSLTPTEVARSGISFEFSFMTESVTAILVYAAASEPNQPAQQQMSSIQSPAHLLPDVSHLSLQQQQLFIAAEVINGKTVVSMNDGSGVVTLHSEAIVNDGLWHRVNAIFSSSHMEVNVDGKSKFLRPSSSSDISSSGIPVTGSAKMPKTLFDQIDFTSVYIGGMHSDREYNALQQNIQSLASEGSVSLLSLVGCVKEMKVNRKVIRSKSSTGTSSGTCGWKFRCLLSEPCEDHATCFQEGLDGFYCLCDRAPCEKRNQTRGRTGISSGDLHHGPEINAYAERGSDYDKEREVSKRVQAGDQDIQQQPNYRQRNHHRGRGSSTSATAVLAAGSSASTSSSSSSSSSTAAASSLSPTSSPSLTLTKGLSLASAAQGNSGKGSAFPVNHVSVGAGWKHDPDPGETNLMQEPVSSGTTSVRQHHPSQQAHPASFISYLGTVISKEQAITSFIIAVISLIAIVLVVMVRGFYLYGRRQENRRQNHKDLNLCNSNSMSGGGSCSGRKDSETTTSACTPLPLGSDFDDPSELLSPPSDLLSPPSLSSRLTSDFPEPLQQQLAPIVHPPAAHPVHSYSTFGRSINRRDSSLFLPLPPPSFYFTNHSSNSFTDLPASPFRFSEYRD